MIDHRSAGVPRGALALGVVALLAGHPAAAQQDTLIDPGDAQARRQVRSLENGAGSAASAEIQLRQARQSLTARSRGVYLTPEQARLDRSLNRIGRDLRRAAPAAPPEPPAAKPSGLPASYPRRPQGPEAASGLPASYDEADAGDGGRQSSAVTVARLLDRAESALGEQRQVQARSDLSTARGFLDDIDPDAPQTRATYAKLQTRLGALQRRVDAAGDGAGDAAAGGGNG